MGDEPFDVAPPKQRDVVTETRSEELDEARTVLRLFLLHLLENPGGRCKILAQPVGEVGVNPAVLLLEGDRKRQNLAFGEIFEASGHPPPSP